VPLSPEGAKRGPGRPSEGVRDAILDAALGALSEDGLARLTTREVARRAGVSEASVFYHFGDKVGLLQAVVLAGLEPLKQLEPAALSGLTDRPLAESLLELTSAQEAFFERALPVLEAVQADTELRRAFAERMVEQDLGPHRGVQLFADYLTAMQQRGVVDADADTRAIAVVLVGASFLRSWQRRLLAGQNAPVLAGLPEITKAVAQVLAPRAGS
jgi:AcrR family transcriptional regulator